MAFRLRALHRALHTSRVVRASEETFNEPGGRLFGEKIRKPGESREVFDWELPYIGTLVLTGIILGFGLNSRPETRSVVWAREEAIARKEALEKE